MSKDVSDVVGAALGRVAREAVQSAASNARKASKGSVDVPKGVAAGVGLAALAPLAVKGAGKVARSIGGDGPGPLAKAGQKVGGGVKDAVGDGMGGATGIAKAGAKSVLPGGGKSAKSKGVPGVGKGRRMPIQQDIDIGAPIKTVYEYWTKFEEWPKFMHRLDQVNQDDDKHISFKTKIWGISKEFKAEIVEQRDGERIKWKVTEGVTHSGVVTFHELGPRLTRVEVNLDVQPGSLLEKAARGMRHIKRAVRADLARFKAYVLMDDEGKAPSGASSSRSRSRSSSSGRSGSRTRAASSRSRSASSRSGGSSSRSRGTSNGRSSGSSASSNRSSAGGSRSSSSGGRSSNGSSRSTGGSTRSSSSRTTASSNGSSNGRSSSRSGSKRQTRSGSRS